MLISTLINIPWYSIHLCISQSYLQGKKMIPQVGPACSASHPAACQLPLNAQGGDGVWQCKAEQMHLETGMGRVITRGHLACALPQDGTCWT